MDKIFRLLIKYAIVWEFIFLEIIAILLIVNNNQFQKSKFYQFNAHVVASVYGLTTGITDYFTLGRTNQDLANENSRLLERVSELENQLDQQFIDTLRMMPEDIVSTVTSAKVVFNSTNKLQNYIIVDKGREDGIKPEMGVINSNGVVGIVESVSDHYAMILPIINPKTRISCKLKKNNYLGSVVWHGVNSKYAHLEEMPRHVNVAVGDSVVTNGFSAIFPENILVGTVTKAKLDDNDAFWDIQIEIAANMQTLSYVSIIDFSRREEIKELMQTTK